MMVGNAVLFLLAAAILMERSWKLTTKDALFWAVVVTVVTLRYIDVTRLGGQTADGEPATRRHLVRYVIGLVGVSGLVWMVAQSFQWG